MSMGREETVSGAILFDRGSLSNKKDGGAYIIRPPRSNQGWSIPTKDITPDDLRAMADHLERQRLSPTHIA